MKSLHQMKVESIMKKMERMQRNVDYVIDALTEYQDNNVDLSGSDDSEVVAIDFLVGFIALCNERGHDFDRIVRAAKQEQIKEFERRK